MNSERRTFSSQKGEADVSVAPEAARQSHTAPDREGRIAISHQTQRDDIRADSFHDLLCREFFAATSTHTLQSGRAATAVRGA
jgi:hypothetical protein